MSYDKKSNKIGETVAFHPGVYMEDYIEQGYSTLEDIASQSGLETSALDEIVMGELDIDEDLANKLDGCCDIPRYLWLSLQDSYDKKRKTMGK